MHKLCKSYFYFSCSHKFALISLSAPGFENFRFKTRDSVSYLVSGIRRFCALCSEVAIVKCIKYVRQKIHIYFRARGRQE